MSKLKDAIQQLMLKQQEVDLFTYVKDAVGGLVKDTEEYGEVKDKVLAEITAFCEKKIRIIEGVEEVRPEPTEKVKESARQADKKVMPPPQDEEEVALRDPLKFIVKYRDWENKQVFVKDGYGNAVEATIIGAAFPNLRVKLMNGTVIPAKPSDVRLMEEINKTKGE